MSANFVDEKTIEVDVSMVFINPVIQGITPEGGYGKVKYNYDRVFNTNTQQADIFGKAMKPIVEGVMEGFNGTVFAYG